MDNFYVGRSHGFGNITATRFSIHGFNQEAIVSLVVVLGSSVSLVGLVFAFITYSLFSDLRNLNGTALMNLLASLFMNQLLFVIGVGGIKDVELCVGLAFALQYIRLTCFCWLLVMTHHTYRYFKESLNEGTVSPVYHLSNLPTTFYQYSLFSWVSPLLFLLTSIMLQYNKHSRYTDISTLKASNCWLLHTNAYFFGFVLPVGLIFVAILVYLLKIYIVVKYTVFMQIGKKAKNKMKRRRTLQLKLYIKLALVTLVVFISMTVYKATNNNIWWIIFNVVQSVQGIIVSLTVTCNCQILKLYTKNLRKKKHGSANELHKTTSLQMLTWEPAPDTV